jgi:glycosyltransferase involved in cell wall biosynthesis
MTQLREYEKVLKKLGHIVDYQWVLKPDLSKTDECWTFHCQFGWNNRQYQEIKRAGIPYRVFAIYYPHFYSDNDAPTVRAILEGAKAIYCLSEEEKVEMLAEHPLSHNRIFIVPNGVDKSIFYNTHEERKYIMTAGRYDGTKGHRGVADLANQLGLPFIMAGPAWNQAELDECARMATGESMVLGPVSQEELNKLYNKARVYVCNSGSERNNLCILEAGAAGCSLINSVFNRGNKWLTAPVESPADGESMKAAILEAYNNPKNYENEIVTWEDAIKMILQ